MKEPFLNLLIVLQSASGRVIRNYTALLDSP
jgi:Tfp pilus assembly protein FimV